MNTTTQRIFRLSSWFLPFFPLIWGLLNLDSIPEIVPNHYNWEGKPDAWGSRWTMLLPIPLVSLFTNTILTVAPMLDPRQENMQQNERILPIIQMGVALLMCALGFAMVGDAMGYQMSSEFFMRLVATGVAGLLLIIGYVMNSVKSNFTVGVRTPWTLSSETVWRKTHRLTGRVWVGGSLFLIVLSLVIPGNWAILTVALGALVMCLIPVVYSYMIWKQEEK